MGAIIETIEPAALSVNAATMYLSLSRDRLYELMSSGTIPSLKVGGRRLLLRADLDEFLLRCKEESGHGL